MDMTSTGSPKAGAVVSGNVLALMGRHRVSQEKLATAIGMSQPSLSKRLRGTVPWTVDDLARIVAYFPNTSIVDLVTLEAT